MESDLVKWIELSEPDLVAAARYRKARFMEEVAEREQWKRERAALPFWKRIFFPACSARAHPNIDIQAENSVEWHIEWYRKNPSELAWAKTSMSFRKMAEQNKESR